MGRPSRASSGSKFGLGKVIVRYVLPVIIISFFFVGYTNKDTDTSKIIDETQRKVPERLTKFRFRVVKDELFITFRYVGAPVVGAEVALTELFEDNYAWPVLKQPRVSMDEFIQEEDEKYTLICSLHPPVLKTTPYFLRKFTVRKAGGSQVSYGEENLTKFGIDLIFKWRSPYSDIQIPKIRRPILHNLTMFKDTEKERIVIDYTIKSENLLKATKSETDLEIIVKSDNDDELTAYGMTRMDGRPFTGNGALYRSYLTKNEGYMCYYVKSLVSQKNRIFIMAADLEKQGIRVKFCI